MAHIDPNQKAFIVATSIATKIDPRVIIAWMAQEGAFSGNLKGQYNYLNIMGSNHQPVSYNGIRDAMVATISVLRQPNMKVILNTAQSQPSPRQQIEAIAASPWDSGHYGGNGGTNLQNTFGSFFGGNAGLDDSYVGPNQAESIASTALSGSGTIGKDPIGATPSVIDAFPGAVNKVARHIPGVAQVEDIGSAVKWVFGNWDRILFVLGGAILIILGLIFIAKQQTAGKNTFTFDRGE